MNTINCRIKTNDFSDTAGIGVTPAEVILLRTVHDKHAGGCCILKARPAGIAMTQVGQKPKVLKVDDTDGNPIEMKTTEPTERPRTDAEEISRLRAKYQVRAKSGAPNSHICDDLFGGSGVVTRLPQTFAELPDQFKKGLIIEIPRPEATNVALLDGDSADPTTDGETEGGKQADPDLQKPNTANPREELLAKTKGELVEIATSYGVEDFAKMNKAELIEAILKKAGYGEQAKAA